VDDWNLKPAKDLGLSGMNRLRSTWRESGLVESAARLPWWLFLRSTFRTWNRLSVIGKENLPAQPPFLLVANHSSHLDALLLTTVLPLQWRGQVFPLAASDVFFEHYSMAAFSAMFINAIPVFRSARKSRGMTEMRERLLSDPCIMILFPEGTRSRTGAMNRFKSGVGMLVAGTSLPVVPCHIQGAFAAMPPHGWFLRPRRLTIRIGPAHSFLEADNKREGWDECARRLEQAVESLKPIEV
jgi:1-acyl-sn-glycerol-3-phosphate acyltransferase